MANTTKVPQELNWIGDSHQKDQPWEEVEVAYPNTPLNDQGEFIPVQIGDNVYLQLDNNVAYIMVNLNQRWGESSTGKSYTVATTRGFKMLPGTEKEGAGGPISINLSVNQMKTRPGRNRRTASTDSSM